jgi:RHS repeat-associated protein
VVAALRAGGSIYGWLYRFQGGRVDPTTGNYIFGARQLDPATGAWISTDPSRFAAGDTNLYRAFGNNPINRVDPSGLEWRDNLTNSLSSAVSSILTAIPDAAASLGNLVSNSVSSLGTYDGRWGFVDGLTSDATSGFRDLSGRLGISFGVNTNSSDYQYGKNSRSCGGSRIVVCEPLCAWADWLYSDAIALICTGIRRVLQSV